MHHKLEKMLGKFGEFIGKHPFIVLLFSLLVIAFPISNIPKITMDTSTEGFLHKEDPMLIKYEAFKEQFGRDERILIAIENEKVFSVEFLTKLKKLHKDLEDNVPYLDEVTSLVNVRNTRGEADQLIVEDLLENFPKTQADADKIKTIAMANEFYKDLLLSHDGKITTIMIETKAFVSDEKENIDDMFSEFDEAPAQDVVKTPLTDTQNAEIVRKVRDIVEKYSDDDFKIYYAGSASVMDALKSMMKEDMQKFTRVTILIILVFLFLIFRRVSATFYPLIVIILSLLTTVGSMAYFGVAFKLPTQIVPSLLIAVSVGATVHVLSIFFDNFNATKDKKGAIAFTLEHSGLAIAMTGLTTAVGIASFAGSEVAPIADMGKFASLGVLISLFLTLTLLPALLMITPMKPKEIKENHWLDNVMRRFAYFPTHHPKSVVVVSLSLVILSIVLATNIKLSHYPLEWFPKDDPNYVGTHYIDDNLNGSLTVEVVVDTKEQNGWQNPKRLQTLDNLNKELAEYDDGKTYIGKVVSLDTIVKESNKALHENNESFYTIPSDQALLSQELLLFENSGSDDLEDVVDSQFSKLRVTVKVPWVDSIESEDMLAHVQKRFEETFKEEEVTVTGIIPILVHTFTQAIRSSVESYIIAFTLIAILMMFIMGNVRLGIISMIPNLSPVIVGLSLMYIYHIPLDMFTLLIGSIAIGLAVDDTIHFMHNFKRYYLRSGDAVVAVENTFFTTGKALVITTIVLSLGFYAYMFGNMESVQNFGFLTGSVIILALIADLLLAPALMVLIAKRGWIK
ncbi:efflux RND transporter permease subunit [Sulfurimonas marina]|uniref:RND transporter n=1 Tax=Sulfurimonas marina TaxID=2590551 RepID=A0A7M1AXC4_9BACT|nr:efflux RND transporter permease subunit [Sulfurimonas marina]QOP41976.1 RND transporter [Sulfurimonas marina]